MSKKAAKPTKKAAKKATKKATKVTHPAKRDAIVAASQRVLISREEYDRFWADVLGRDWYEDDDVDRLGPLVDLSDIPIAWQGEGSRTPRPNKHIRRSEICLDGFYPELSVSLTTIYRRWKASQTHERMVVMVPKARASAFVKSLKKFSAEVLGEE